MMNGASGVDHVTRVASTLANAPRSPVRTLNSSVIHTTLASGVALEITRIDGSGHTESLLLANVVDPEVTRSELQVIPHQSKRLGQLLDDLFLLSTSESGALPLISRPVRLD